MNNFNNMIKQAQDLQKKMAEAQEKVETLEAEGISGGGIVKITINGKNNVTSVNIDETAIDKNEKEILEDLIVAAFNDARDKIQRKIADEMSSLTGGIKLPQGMKLPF
jgi:DNA-binding YbaB/EbfC family protein